MQKNNPIKSHNEVPVLGIILIISVIFALVIGVRWHGDGPTYYLMIESLIKDGDFILDNRDIARWQDNRFEDMADGTYVAPAGVYALIDKNGIIKYADPLLYPFIAAPFFVLFNKAGLSLLNGLLLGGSIAVCYLFLKHYFKRKDSLILSAAFFLCSFIPAYLAWIHPEMMIFFACSLYMWLWLSKGKTTLSGLIVGIVSIAKIIFLPLLLPMAVILIFKRRFVALSKAIGACLLGMGFMLLLTFLFFGRFSAYSGEGGYGRLSSQTTPYLTTEAVKGGLGAVPLPFEGAKFNGWKLFFKNILIFFNAEGTEFNDWRLFLNNALNFFAGRFTGVIWYAFPGFICVGIYLLYRRRIEQEEKILGDSILITALLLAAILITARPLSYFGGRDFIGNRYFFIIPALIFLPALKAVKRPKRILLLFLPGLLISAQIIKNEIFIKNSNVSHVAHTTTFPLKYAPLEFMQVESFMLYNTRLKISEGIFLYSPSGTEKQTGKKILIAPGQELVVVRKDSIKNAIFTTDGRQLQLQSQFTLKNKINGETKFFYYFKAGRPAWIKISGLKRIERELSIRIG